MLLTASLRNDALSALLTAAWFGSLPHGLVVTSNSNQQRLAYREHWPRFKREGPCRNARQDGSRPARAHGHGGDQIASSRDLLRDLEATDNRLDEVSDILLIDADFRVRATTARSDASAVALLEDHDCFLLLRASDAGTCISRPSYDPAIGHIYFR